MDALTLAYSAAISQGKTNVSSPITQYIRPRTKRNGYLFMVTGIGSLALLMLVHSVYELAWPAHLTLAGACLVMIALGVGKIIEPETSLEITPTDITYLHFRGRWTLHWDDVQRFDIPKLSRGLEQIETPFLGIRLRQYDQFLSQLSPRLAVHLVYQQRPLMMQAIRSEMPPHREYLDYVDVPDVFVSACGNTYRGVIATFATRMSLMREMLGFDLYISQNALDRPLPEFINHLKALQATRQQHLED